MESAKEALFQIDSSLKDLGSQTPAQMRAFSQMLEAIEAPGKLDRKTKELIAVCLSIASKCHWCIALHVKNALDSGATREEILEASWVAVLMGGGPALMQIQLIQKALDDLA
ncbi:MAG: carboxymuconolactone decarboxylase family protein [Dehalococcoidales bacterium]|jgi:AhpD family alkylhydroperoxidase|nr:carboxymuconolactone decarboxylase family protein [Dehalococcoidales bacterium]MDD5604701.1 carboxymuconolactone decarboxylase family protein [Dehalococcoidales bacterium]MDX9985985.1 carboxymuconolactone decarboxylase family protein [Dehalococcoidales bacterium]NLE90656.1 carboxymuconolactone decarboxylase family protein [Dehalococcoidales bacterium]